MVFIVFAYGSMSFVSYAEIMKKGAFKLQSFFSDSWTLFSVNSNLIICTVLILLSIQICVYLLGAGVNKDAAT